MSKVDPWSEQAFERLVEEATARYQQRNLTVVWVGVATLILLAGAIIWRVIL